MEINYKVIKIFISTQMMIIASLTPSYIFFPNNQNPLKVIELPITWLTTIIIFLTLIFGGVITYVSHSLYIFIGLFVLPIFNDGGSLGYILTPNFAYILSIYLLIMSIERLNKTKKKLTINSLFRSSILGLSLMHLSSILYITILLKIFNQEDLFLYTLGKYSLSNFPFEIIMIFPLSLFIKQINILRNNHQC